MSENNDGISQITILNSGIVLLGPYFEILFSHLRLIDNNEFIDLNSKKKAIALLNYINSGKDSIGTEDLSLFKIICDINPNDHLDFDTTLVESEKSLVDSMLSSFLRKWEPMSINTINEIRTSFFQREGDLTEDENAYILLVDQKNYDVLIETLPWDYKSIRLPWMKKIIIISWN